MIIMIILTCVLSFITGVLIGNKNHSLLSGYEKKRKAEIQKLKEEYKNFLEYDGSEQP